jgi:hypothetical protein
VATKISWLRKHKLIKIQLREIWSFTALFVKILKYSDVVPRHWGCVLDVSKALFINDSRSDSIIICAERLPGTFCMECLLWYPFKITFTLDITPYITVLYDVTAYKIVTLILSAKRNSHFVCRTFTFCCHSSHITLTSVLS